MNCLYEKEKAMVHITADRWDVNYQERIHGLWEVTQHSRFLQEDCPHWDMIEEWQRASNEEMMNEKPQSTDEECSQDARNRRAMHYQGCNTTTWCIV